jgi:acyl-CoA hydrolase
MLDLQRQRQARVRMRMRKRVEGAMPHAQSADDRTTLRFADGTMSAGRVMRWIDEAACACGAEWAGAEVITSYVAGIRFCHPILVGQTVEVSARVIHTGPRSVHIRVTAADLVAYGVVVVVALDARGEARPVPRWEATSDPDQRDEMPALQLIELRQFIEPFTTAAAIS